MSKISPFSAEFPIIDHILGVELYTANTGMRYKKDDLLLVKFPKKANVAGIFTKNTVVGEPVNWCKKILHNKIASGLVVNSGYSNVFCGEIGVKTVEKTVEKTSKILNCNHNEIYISSTGIIGQPVKDELLLEALDKKLKPANYEQACVAINTTDTFNKGAYTEVTIADKKVIIAGIIKGSGMIAPNMATMLGFIFTDANISSEILQELLNEIKDKTYNAITVDSDTSTSDTILAFATAQAGNKKVTSINETEFQEFRKAFFEVNLQLAKLVIKDGEGVTKFVTIEVLGAENDNSALKIALSIANSPLVKTAIAGEDANWGRIIAAIGKSEQKINLEKLGIHIGNLQPAKNGGLNPEYSEKQASEYMKNSYIDIKIDVAVANGKAKVYTTDLTHEYISINADYRS